VSTAGPAIVVDTIELTGTVQALPSGISEVRARFPGLVKKIYRDVGEEVSAGDVLAVVESNESLRDYNVKAPISGLIVDRDLQVGQVAADEPLYQIVDLSTVWVQLDALGRSAARVATGQRVRVITLDGVEIDGTIEWLSPLVAHGSQSQRARVPLPNPDRRIRPGQFVRGIVTITSSEVPLAVKITALQTLDDTDVVFEKNGTTYTARTVSLGRRDNQFVELLKGLYPGAVYVSENSYLIKADIEKSGATHQH
jgi:cobalt-zinc-cadmium efflux system membrane fusion protein